MSELSTVDDPDVLSAEQEDAALRGASWQRLAILGDSLAEAALADPVDGYERLNWPGRLERALRRQVPVLEVTNLGIRNLTAAQVLSEQLSAALAFAPDLACVICGGNDVLRRGFDPEATERDVVAIVDPLLDAGARVALITTFDTAGTIPTPEPYATRIAERMPTLHRMLRDVAGARDQVVLVDLAAHPRGSDPGLFSKDGIHTNDAGQAVIASAVIGALGTVTG